MAAATMTPPPVYPLFGPHQLDHRSAHSAHLKRRRSAPSPDFSVWSPAHSTSDDDSGPEGVPKRRRRSPPPPHRPDPRAPPADDDATDDWRDGLHADRAPPPAKRARVAAALGPSLVRAPAAPPTPPANAEEWAALQRAFAHAVELSDSDDVPIRAALEALRGVLSLCTDFLARHTDPCAFFAPPPSPPAWPRRGRSASPLPTPPAERARRSWGRGSNSPSTSDDEFDTAAHALARATAEHADDDDEPEPPSAFHTLFGATLFHTGRALAREPALAGPEDAPAMPSARTHTPGTRYLRAALGLFDAGERACAQHAQGAPDWRAAVARGRTLVALADAAAQREEREERIQRLAGPGARGPLPTPPPTGDAERADEAPPAPADDAEPSPADLARTLSVFRRAMSPAGGFPFPAAAPPTEAYAPGTALHAAHALAGRTAAPGTPTEHTGAHALLTRASDAVARGVLHMPRRGEAPARALHAAARDVLALVPRLRPEHAACWARWARAQLAQAACGDGDSDSDGGETSLAPAALPIARASAALLQGRAHAALGQRGEARDALRAALEHLNTARAGEARCRRLRGEVLRAFGAIGVVG